MAGFYQQQAKPPVKSNMPCDTSQDRELPQPPDDTVSGLAWSPRSDVLAVSSWDNSVRVYDVSQPQIQPVSAYNHEGPVLDVCWSADGSRVFSGGADGNVVMHDPATQQNVLVGKHDGAVKNVRYVVRPSGQFLLSGSWDKTVRVWSFANPQAPSHVATFRLEDKVTAMDCRDNMIAILSGGFNVYLINFDDLANEQNPHNIIRQPVAPAPPLKFPARSIAVCPDQLAYTIGGIDGRVYVQFAVPGKPEVMQRERVNAQGKTEYRVKPVTDYSFRCHRVTKEIPKPKPANFQEQNHVFAVNALCVHPKYNTCLTAGGDGTFSSWDIKHKKLLKNHTPKGSQTPTFANYSNPGGPRAMPLAAAAYSETQGHLLAYSVGYDWAQGYRGSLPGQPNPIFIHAVTEEEVKERPPELGPNDILLR